MTENEGKSKESIWSIHPDWRVWFYRVLSVYGIGVSVFTVWTLWGKSDKSWIDIFDAVWNGIVGSVVFVWFAYQAFDWGLSAIMSAGDYFLRQIERRKEEDRKREEELQEKGRQEERERVRKYIEAVGQKKMPSAEDILRFLEQTKGLGNLEKKRED